MYNLNAWRKEQSGKTYSFAIRFARVNVTNQAFMSIIVIPRAASRKIKQRKTLILTEKQMRWNIDESILKS